MSRIQKILQIFIIIMIGTYSYGQGFEFYGKVIEPGKKENLILIAKEHQNVELPVTVINGSKKGPVLGIVSGIYGYEYSSIIAIQNFIKSVNPKDVKGTLIIVNIANIPAFLRKKNNANNLIPRKIESLITKEVISKCEVLLGIRTGNHYEDIISYAEYFNDPNNQILTEKGKKMASVFGFNYVVASEEKVRYSEFSFILREASFRNISVTEIKCGGNKQVEDIESSINKLMVYLKMKKGNNSPNNSIIIEERNNIKSGNAGIFYSDLKSGDNVRKGQKIGYITDYFGNKLQDVVSNTPGVILYKVDSPIVSKDEIIFNVGIIYL